MRVDLNQLATEPLQKSKPDRTRAAAAGGEHANEIAIPDQTHFSFDQSRVKSLASQALAHPEVRQQRVDLLRQSLGKGEYSISDSRVADAVIADLTNGSTAQRSE
jgi:flagellar biosynthesis anti-sigma factor FlgM